MHDRVGSEPLKWADNATVSNEQRNYKFLSFIYLMMSHESYTLADSADSRALLSIDRDRELWLH